MKSLNKYGLPLVITAGAIFSSCQKNNTAVPNDELSDQKKIIIPNETKSSNTSIARTTTEVEYNTFYGPVVQMGEGHARSWVNITHDDKPLAIGIEMTQGALQNHHQETDVHGLEFLMPLHQKAKALLPFDHLVANYNEHGHPPVGIYTVPHFDFHFYKMSLEERLTIPAYAPASAFDNNPAAGYLPPLYVKNPGGIEKMGAHWSDVTSPEFHGQPFTHTFVYGSYDGKVTFLEPMATLAFMQGGTAVHKEIRQPQLFDPVNTFYPTRYNIWKNETNCRHYVALDEMVWR